MRRTPTFNEASLERVATGLLGGVLLATAGLSAGLARDHMILLGAICGAGHAPHCGWCYGAVGFALAGLTAFALALRPQPRRAVVTQPHGEQGHT